MKKIRLAGVEQESIVDGPGIRYSIFTQGCPHCCVACHNESTWDYNKGYLEDIDKLQNQWKTNPLLDGITLSGGEPLIQLDETIEILRRAKNDNLSTMVYTGYTYEEIISSNLIKVLDYIDILVEGRFILELRDLTLLFKGSTNQRVIDVKKTLEFGEIIIFEFN